MSTTTASQKTIFSKVLVAIDGSDASMDAADYAVSISEQYNAELLYALHVIHPADADLFGSTGEMTTAAYYTIDMNKEAQKYLDEVKLSECGWDESKIQREVVVTSSAILDPKGNRRPPRFADYILYMEENLC